MKKRSHLISQLAALNFNFGQAIDVPYQVMQLG